MNLVNRMKKIIKKKTVPTTATIVAKAPVASVAPKLTLTSKAAPVKAAPSKAKPVTSTAPITIEAKIDVGFGNLLFVRGQGAGLSWERGIQLENVDSKTWRLKVPAKDNLQFKLLINDTVWSQGEDMIAAPGKRVEVVPAF